MKTAGHLIIMDANGGEEQLETVACAHCQRQLNRALIHTLGWCMRCMAPTCPTAACDECVPFLKKIEEYERGKRSVL